MQDGRLTCISSFMHAGACFAARFFPRALDMYSRRLLGTPKTCARNQTQNALHRDEYRCLQQRYCLLSKTWNPKCSQCRGDHFCLHRLCHEFISLRESNMPGSLRHGLSSSASRAELLATSRRRQDGTKPVRHDTYGRVLGTSRNQACGPVSVAANLGWHK